MEKTYFDRNIAYEVVIKELLNYSYIENDEGTPNYLLAKNKKIYRFNLLAVILELNQQGSILNITVDDGSGKIILRIFEENKSVNNLVIGESILIIGKLRKYNHERYISPEIIKKVDGDWLKVRSLKIDRNKINNEINEISPKPGGEEKTTKKEIKSNKEINEKEIFPIKKIILLIKELDQGEGVFIEEIIEKSKIELTDKIIEKMLEEGEIFQNLPGKVKVL